MVNKAKESKDKFVLIIDEINRGNLPAILGELMYALEYRKEKFALMYKKEENYIPDNLYIIGTMNTADRSIGNIDYALRRRFAFYYIGPDETKIKDEKAKEVFNKINKFLEDKISQDYDLNDIKIGHTYFLKDNWKDEVKYKVIPLLKEYKKDGIIILEKDSLENELKDFLEKLDEKNELKDLLENLLN